MNKKSNKRASTKEGSNLISNIQPLISRDHRGITLVALIITIIVMLILVGVSITIAIKGELFDTTKKAAKDTKKEIEAEQELSNGRVKIDGAWYDSIEDYVGGNESEDQTDPERPVEPETPEEPETPQAPDTAIKTYDETAKDGNGVLTANATYRSDGKTAVIPKGFKIVDGIEGTKSIADGLVIQDKEGNEFVWIPVEVAESDTETSIASFYRSRWVNNARATGLSTDYIEPYDGYIGEAEEYAEMVKSVYKNKGFYIGRYEAGSTTERTDTANGTTTMVVKKNQFVYNYVGWGASMSDYTSDIVSSGKNQGKGAVLLSKEMYEGKGVGVTSTLCYGVQWEAMLDFIKDKKDVTNSTSWGRYTDRKSRTANTGLSDTYSAKNIYDVAGNVREWTMESYSSINRVNMGGNNQYPNGTNYYPASDRSYYDPSDCNWHIGFRLALYIK